MLLRLSIVFSCDGLSRMTRNDILQTATVLPIPGIFTQSI